MKFVYPRPSIPQNAIPNLLEAPDMSCTKALKAFWKDQRDPNIIPLGEQGLWWARQDLAVLSDRYRQAQWLDLLGIKQPAWHLANPDAPLPGWFKTLSYRSKGTHRCTGLESSEERDGRWEALNSDLCALYTAAGNGNASCIFQQHIEGRHIDVNLAQSKSENVICVHEEIWNQDLSFIEHYEPRICKPDSIWEKAAQVAEILGSHIYKSGPGFINVELVAKGREVYVIEFHCRPGDDFSDKGYNSNVWVPEQCYRFLNENS